MPQITAYDSKHGQVQLATYKVPANSRMKNVQVVVRQPQSSVMVRPPRRARKGRVSSRGSNQSLSKQYTAIRPPVVNAFSVRSLGIGLPDMPLDVSYVAGYIGVGDGTGGGLQDNVAFVPSQNAFTGGAPSSATVFCARYVPVLPADCSSLGSFVSQAGFGTLYINDVMKHYSRVRYDRITLDVLPRGAGASTNGGITVAFAPFRGTMDGGSAVTASSPNSPYLCLQGGTGSSGTTVNLLGSKGSMQFPLFEPQRFDLTPYIAGGSGSRQNEFAINTGSGNIAAATVYYNSAFTPCSFAFGGTNTNAANRGFILATVIIRVRMQLLDYFSSMGNQNAIGVVAPQRELEDVKAPPPRLDFKSALGRLVVDKAPSPTQSLLGAALDSTYVDPPVPSRTRSAAMPIPPSKR